MIPAWSRWDTGMPSFTAAKRRLPPAARRRGFRTITPACEVFLAALGKDLPDLFADPQLAKNLIGSLKDTAAKSVEKDIHDHKDLWQKKSPKEQEILQKQADSGLRAKEDIAPIVPPAPVRLSCAAGPGQRCHRNRPG